MFMVLRTATADENRSKGAPVARPSTGKRGQLCRTPEASGTADLIKHRAAGLFSPQMFMVLRTTTADENRLQGAPPARPATGKRAQMCRTPEASGTSELIKHRAAGLFSPQFPMAPLRWCRPRP